MHLRTDSFLTVTALTAALLAMSACSDMLEIQPPADEITPATALDQPEAVEALVNEMYTGTINNMGYLYRNLGMTADETEPYSQPSPSDHIAGNTYDAENIGIFFWRDAYPVIYTTNTLLEKLPDAAVISDQTRRQYLAEAHFMRAYYYFHLVNLYGDVPLVLKTDPGQSIGMPRTPADDVWTAIIDDLEQALDLAPVDFDDSGRANQWAIRSLLARVHLYRENWDQAETMATEVIRDSPFSLEMDINEVFAADNPGAIFIPPIGSSSSLFNGNIFPYALGYLPGFGPPTLVARGELVNAFESGDNRLNAWTGTYGSDRHPYKYTNGVFAVNRPEDLQHIRLAELYLIRAEARAQQNNVTGPASAESDLNEVRSRAGLGGTTAATQADMLDAIIHERRIELFAEGHRWFDLKRTGRMDAVLGALKGAWEPYKKLFPVPQVHLEAAPQYDQNPDW